MPAGSFTMTRSIRPNFVVTVLVSAGIAGGLVLLVTATVSGVLPDRQRVVVEVQQAPQRHMEP
jgi:hypothetical protein